VGSPDEAAVGIVPRTSEAAEVSLIMANKIVSPSGRKDCSYPKLKYICRCS
jgi:hypothetical protein